MLAGSTYASRPREILWLQMGYKPDSTTIVRSGIDERFAKNYAASSAPIGSILKHCNDLRVVMAS